jgi:hypothetical protein
MIRSTSASMTRAVSSLTIFDEPLHQPESLAHPPTRDHVPCEGGGLLDVVLGARGLRAVHELLRGAATEHADNARAKILFRVVVAIAVGALVRHA